MKAKYGAECTFEGFHIGFPGGSGSTESACNAGELGSFPGLGRFPGEGNGNPLQYSCLENPTDSEAWLATVHEVAELDTTERLTFSLPQHRPGYRFCKSLPNLTQECTIYYIQTTINKQMFLLNFRKFDL